MAERRVGTQIIDHVDGQPAIVLPNGNWGVFNSGNNKYEDTGNKAVPEDDLDAIKYYKLSDSTTTLGAPSDPSGWATLPELNTALTNNGWAYDPLDTSPTNKFCWVAIYALEYIMDVDKTASTGTVTHKKKYTFRKVALWSNYADSPTIEVTGNTITIKNPGKPAESVKVATATAMTELAALMEQMQEQVDGAVYSYNLEGKPTVKATAGAGENIEPATSWRREKDGTVITDEDLIRDIYAAHVGDTYTDLVSYRSYRFVKTGTTDSSHLGYGWEIIADDAISTMLSDIAKLGRTKITVFTVDNATPHPYKKGDMWVQSDNTMKVAIQDSDTFNSDHWIQPYATKVEVDEVKVDLANAKADAQATANNLDNLNDSLSSLTDGVGKAIKDNIITEAELRDLQTFSDSLDVEQAKMLSTVTYLLSSKFLPQPNKDTIGGSNGIKIRFLDEGGSIDQLQEAILEMDANNDGVIDAGERANYNSKLGIYKGHATEMENAVSDARKAIDLRLEAITDEKIDAIPYEGRNLLLNSNFTTVPSVGVAGTVTVANNEVTVVKTAAIHFGFALKFSDILVKGEKYILSFELKTSDVDNLSFVSLRTGVTDTNFGTPSGGNYAIPGIAIDGEYKKYTLVMSPTTAISDGIVIGSAGHGQSFSVRNIKFEKGNKVTDWTPAPEDIQSNIDRVSSSLTTLVGTTKDALEDGIIDKTERAKITELDRALDIEQERLISTVWAIKENPNLDMITEGLLNAASDAVLKADTGSIDKLQAQLQIILAKTKVTEADKNSYTTLYNTFKTTMKALEVAIINAQEAISKNSIDNIEIGGRNLFLNSDFSRGFDYYWDRLNSSPMSNFEIVGTALKATFVEGSNTDFGKRNFIQTHDFSSTDNIVVSAMIKGEGDLKIRFGNASTQIPVLHINNEIFKKFTQIIPKSEFGNGSLVFEVLGGELLFDRLKVEKGNKATDWTPATEDVQANIETAKTEAESAAKDYAKTKAEAERVLAEAYADGIVSDEEQARIDDVNAKLAAAKEYAEAQDALLKTQQEAYADGAISTAEQAAIDAAKAYADLKKTESDAYADGKVSAEEARAIADALEKYNESKAHAEQLVNNIEIGGRNLFIKSTVTTGSYLIDTGEIKTLASWSITDYIPVESGKQYIASGYSSLGLAPSTVFYDADKEYISGIQNGNINGPIENDQRRLVTTPSGSAYMRFSFMGVDSGSLKIEKGAYATDWNDGTGPILELPDYVQAEIDAGVAIVTTLYKNADDGVTVNKPTAESEVSDGWRETSPAKVKGKVIWSVNRVTLKNGTKLYQNPANIQGAEGEDALSVSITRQGSFKTTWTQVSEGGDILPEPNRVSRVIGGVKDTDDIEKVKLTGYVYKGSRDVTSSALTGGANPRWYVNGGTTAYFSGKFELLIGIDVDAGFGDGEDDDIQLEIDTTNAKNW